MHKRLAQALDRVERLRGAGRPTPTSSGKAQTFASVKMDWCVVVAHDRRQPPLAACIANILCCCMDPDTGEVWMSLPALAAACGATERGAQKALKPMVDEGFVAKSRSSRGGHQTTCYLPALGGVPLLTLFHGDGPGGNETPPLGVNETPPLEGGPGVNETTPLGANKTTFQGRTKRPPNYLREIPTCPGAGAPACEGARAPAHEGPAEPPAPDPPPPADREALTPAEAKVSAMRAAINARLRAAEAMPPSQFRPCDEIVRKAGGEQGWVTAVHRDPTCPSVDYLTVLFHDRAVRQVLSSGVRRPHQPRRREAAP